jgi:integrase
MAGQKRTKTEYRGIYYNETTGKYDIKFNYKSYNAAKQRNDYKSKWKYNVATIGEAKAELALMQSGKNRQEDRDITLQGAFELWKNKARAQDYSPATVVNTEQHIRMLSEFIPMDTAIQNITEDVYEDIFARCRSKYKDETIKTLNATLRKLINLAYKKRLLGENPLVRMDNVKTKKTEKVRVITTGEWKKIDSFFNSEKRKYKKLRFMVNILYYTGIRIGECLALTWDDFEEFVRSAEQNEGGAEQSKKGMRLSISKTILQDGTPKDTTKNKKNRKIPLSPEVVGLYTENYEIRAEERSDRIFTCTYNTYIWYLTMVCRKTGIPHCSCHSFRHTFISNLIRKGVPLPVIEKVSGDTQKTIFERYSHMFEDDEGLVLRALENL